MSSDNKELTALTGLNRTKQWFEIAVPTPTIKQACIQIGCGYEETAELAGTLGDVQLSMQLYRGSNKWKKAGKNEIKHISSDLDRVQFLDDIVDEIVTRIGKAHMLGMDILGALEEVNRSNFSKFENGKPLFNEQGKISKGEHYTPPNLTPYI